MTRSEVRIPVQHGPTVAHVPSTADAALMLALNVASNTLAAGIYEETTNLLDTATSTANVILSLLIKPCCLTGKATKCLGTAPRASSVRATLVDSMTGQQCDLLR